MTDTNTQPDPLQQDSPLPCMVRVPQIHALYDYLSGFHRAGGQSRAAEVLRLAEVGFQVEMAQRAALHVPGLNGARQLSASSHCSSKPPLVRPPSHTTGVNPTPLVQNTARSRAATDALSDAFASLDGVQLDIF